MGTYVELTTAGVTTRVASALTGVSRATATRANTPPAAADRAPSPAAWPSPVPANKLSLAERTRVLEVLDSAEFIDQPPLQVYARLLERGQYLSSVSTMYRILAEAGQVKERRRQARHPARAVPELVATGPGQVYSWDITKLPGPAKGVYYDAYVMIDIYSRYIGRRPRPRPRGRGARRGTDARDLRGPRHPRRGARRPRNLDDLQIGGDPARRPRGHPFPLAAQRLQRQPVLRVAVQDDEVPAGLPRQVRIRGRGPRVHEQIRRRVTICR